MIYIIAYKGEPATFRKLHEVIVGGEMQSRFAEMADTYFAAPTIKAIHDWFYAYFAPWESRDKNIDIELAQIVMPLKGTAIA